MPYPNYTTDIYPILSNMQDSELLMISNDSITSDKMLNHIVGYQTLYNNIVNYQQSKGFRTDTYIIKSMIGNCIIHYCGMKYLNNITKEVFDKI